MIKNFIRFLRAQSLSFMLFLVFLALKLFGVISWSWIWVTSPLWIPFAIALGFLSLVLMLFVIALVAIIISLIINPEGTKNKISVVFNKKQDVVDKKVKLVNRKSKKNR